MNIGNPGKSDQSSASGESTRKGRLIPWIVIIVAVVILVIGYALVKNWKNFTNGLGGKPEAVTHIQ